MTLAKPYSREVPKISARLTHQNLYSRPRMVECVLLLCNLYPRNSKIPVRSIELSLMCNFGWLIGDIDMLVCQKVVIACNIMTFE